MRLLLNPAPGKDKVISFWNDPHAWIREKNLNRGYWIFFTAAFFFDAGFSVYFFLFNLFLLDCGFRERAMGWIGGALTLGSVAGTLPAGALAKRFGIRPLLLALFVAAPTLNALRTVWIWEPAQIVLAFLAGLAMSGWGVSFLTAVGRLTTEHNRTSGFSLIFCVSIGTGILGGILCGYLRFWLSEAGFVMQPAEVKRLILIASCILVLFGLLPVLRLRMPSQDAFYDDGNRPELAPAHIGWLHRETFSPFLIRFLPAMALWSGILAAFTPYANIYLTRIMHIPIEQIGLAFSAVQIVQLGMGIVTPIVFRRLGLVRGIVATQMAAAVTLAILSGAHTGMLAIGLYLLFSAAQWMSSPGLYNLLMSEIADKDRSTAAAMTLFCNALAGSAATAAAGLLFTRFGYPPVLLGISVAALGVALFFLLLVAPLQRLKAAASSQSA